ncbi:MAG: hypothetical protein ACRDD1_18115 [Planctomycetia bacterium]
MLGIDAKLYRNTGTYGTPTWTSVDCISDCAVSPVWDKNEVMIRASRTKMQVKTMLGIEVAAKLLATLSGDTQLIAIQDAMNSDAQHDFLVLNAATTAIGARGWRFWGQVFQASESQNPGDTLFYDCVIAPTLPIDGNYPKHAEVTTGPALTLTAVGTAP